MMIFKTVSLNDSAKYDAKKKASVEYRGLN